MNKLRSASVLLILVTLLFGMSASIQALGVSFSIYGQVFDTDGTTPVDGVTVTVTNLETGSSLDPVVTSAGGYYVVNLANLKPNEAHSAGDSIQITADDGAGKRNTVVVARATASPQQVNVILQNYTTPQVAFLEPPTPANNSEVQTGRITVTVTASSSSGIDEVLLNWNGTAYMMFATAQDEYSFELTGLSNGQYSYFVQASDIAGNVGQTETRVVTINITTYTMTLSLTSGFTIISPPLDDPTVTDAATLATKIGANCNEVVNWNSASQTFSSYVPGVPLNNFAIAGGEGYFVNLNNPTVVAFSGAGWPSPFAVSLPVGFSIIGLPVNDVAVTDASTLATKIGANCIELVKWNSATQSYSSYVPGVPLNNFAIAGGEGYFANLNNPTAVTFEGTPWQD
jgi:hypothetical protein